MRGASTQTAAASEFGAAAHETHVAETPTVPDCSDADDSVPAVQLLHGDCRTMMSGLADGSVHAVVTDPPYEIGFMATASRRWDSTGVAFDPAVWQECLRVLKPGGHLLAFGAPRSWHRLAVAIEDAGFEIRDSIAWLTGQGMPKSLDVAKAIDRHLGAQPRAASSGHPRRRLMPGAQQHRTGSRINVDGRENVPTETGAADAARPWSEYGTNMKPGHEPIILARRPLDGTVAATALKHGTGGLNIDACRIGDGAGSRSRDGEASTDRIYDYRGGTDFRFAPGPRGGAAVGRWPTNVALDGAAADALDEQSGVLTSGRMPAGTVRGTDGSGRAVYGRFTGVANVRDTPGDTGGASRFFPVFRYAAKATANERPRVDGVAHNTVKPLALMRWLVRLVTPPGGDSVVLDPFAGSGTTIEAAILEGISVVGIEQDARYLPLIIDRATHPVGPLTTRALSRHSGTVTDTG